MDADGLAGWDGGMTLACDAHPTASTVGAPAGPAAGPQLPGPGAGLALTSVLCVQLGAAASTSC